MTDAGSTRDAARPGEAPFHVVTGAFGYSGRYMAAKLLERGERVRTITNSPDRANPFGGRVEAHRFHFDEPDKLTESLRGASVLYNTYWVRFNYGRETNPTEFRYSEAVDNTLVLFEAAKAAGVGRIVHVSITNPSEDSPLEYFSGKAVLEKALAASGIPHTILRPAVLFGHGDILVNNIAWALRRLPVFGVFGDGKYRLQPIYVEDFAELAVRQGRESGNVVIDAIGPETFTYRELVGALGDILGKRRPVFSVPPWVGFAAAKLIGGAMGDVLLTRDEIEGLMEDLLHTSSPPAGATKLTDWARENSKTLGTHYSNELARRRNRRAAYENL